MHLSVFTYILTKCTVKEAKNIYLSIRFYDSCRRLPETKHHSSLFLHSFCSIFLVVMAACTPSIHVFLGRPLFRKKYHCKIFTPTNTKLNSVALVRERTIPIERPPSVGEDQHMVVMCS
jgi:hypothetical protein